MDFPFAAEKETAHQVPRWMSCGITQIKVEKLSQEQQDSLLHPFKSDLRNFNVSILDEKWVEGKAPFETIREYLDAGHLKITMTVPQGVVQWEQVTSPDGQVVMQKAVDLVKV